MKHYFTLGFLVVNCFLLHAQNQDNSDIIKSIQELNTKLSELEKMNLKNKSENESFKRIFYIKDSISYFESYNNLAFALENGDVLENNFESAINDITKDPVLVKLIEANNPMSDVLGFKFVDVVIEASKSAFSKGLSDGNEKQRWNNIVDKIINNDIVKSVLQSNPITSAVSSIVNMAANFSTTTLGKKAVETKDAFKQEQIKEFISTLQPYIEFYDQLILTGNTYIHEVERVKEKYSHLNLTAKKFNTELLQTLKFNNTSGVSLSSQLQILYRYELDMDNKEKYGDVLKRDKISKATEFIEDFTKLNNDVKNLQSEYNIALINFLEDYKGHLESAKNFKKDMDQKKIDSLLSNISNLIKRLLESSNRAFK